MVTNCDQNNHQIRFFFAKYYKIKVMIEFSDQLSQNNWYLTLAIKILTITSNIFIFNNIILSIRIHFHY